MKAYQEINSLKSPALCQLMGFLRQHRQVWADRIPDVEAFERELHTHVTALERELLAEELARYDVDAEAIQVNGIVCKQAMTASEDYQTTVGVVTIERRLYRPPGQNSRHVCPLELQAGIVAGFFTPAAARQAAYVVAHLPPATGAQLFDELGSMQPSASSLARLPKDLSARWETHRQEWEASLRSLERVPSEAVTLVVSLDGVLAPMRTPQPEKAAPSPPDKQPKGPKGYQEVGCGAVSLYDAEGERLQTVRYGRMPESGKVTLAQQLQAECQAVLTVRPNLKIARLSDGARHNWKLLSALDFGLPLSSGQLWDIVDFYHACDHLKHAADLIWGEFSPGAQAEFKRWKTLLKEAPGGADVIIRALRYRVGKARGHKREQLARELTYFRNQRHRMNYPAYLRQHLPIASGVVEATCKTLVTQRLKQSGMRWSHEGGQAILTLRSLIQSNRWEAGWRFLRTNCQQPITVVAAKTYFALPLAA